MNLDLTRGKRPWLQVILVFVIILHACQPEVPAVLIEIETGSIDEVGPTFCVIEGEIHDLGENGVLQHGFVWSESPDPTMENGTKNELGGTSDLGIYSSTISGLSPNTTYYVKAYGTGEAGGDQTSYGMEKSFITTPPTVPALPHSASLYSRGILGSGRRPDNP